MGIQLPPAVADVLRVVAPTLLAGLSLTGPIGAAVAGVASLALKAWLPTEKQVDLTVNGAQATQPEVVRVIQENASNASFLRDLKRAELDAQQLEAEMGFKFAELQQKDRSDARVMARDSGIARPQFIAGMSIVTLSMLLLFGVVTGCVLALTGKLEVDPASAQIAIAAFGLIGTVVGAFQGISAQILAFYFGSSASSHEKQTQIGDTMRDLGVALGDAANRGPAAPLPAPLPAPPPQPPVIVVPGGPTSPDPDPAAPVGPTRFIGLVEKLMDHEGGYVDNSHDPGGCTNIGITLTTLREWRHDMGLTCDDVRALTRADARAIYFAKYWNALRCDDLPPGLDYEVFDFGVNAGVSRSAKTLQTLLADRDPSLKVDGVIGPQTIAALAKASPRALVDEFHAARMAFYQSLPTWGTFGNGWTRRAGDVFAEAMAATGNVRTAA
jgi:lysozyme family protein